MKDFIIYLQPRNPRILEKERYLVEELKELPSSSILTELELIKGGELKFIRETTFLNLFSFSCHFQHPRPWAAESTEYAKMVVDLWQQKKGNLVASFNAPKKLSKIIIALLSYATMGDPFLIPRSIKLSRSNFISLIEHIMSSGGEVKQYIFILPPIKDPSKANVKYHRQSGDRLEKSPEFWDKLNCASQIRLLGFAFKPADCRKISFRITDRGGGQLYHPADPLDHEILEFLNLFNHTLLP